MKHDLSLNRRKLLQYGAIALGTTVAVNGLTANLTHAESTDINSQTSNENITPDEALNLLMEGNKRFVNNQSQYPNQDFEHIAEVAKEQFPFASILACADSRLPVEIIFDQGFGDTFVVRDAGNIATPEEIGSLEFGSAVLGSKLILVLGHEECGAVKATIAGKPVPGSIGSILAAIKPAIKEGDKTSKSYLIDTVKRNVLLQIDRLNSSPVISQLISENQLKIVGGYFDLNTAEVQLIT
ncbi:MAG TPA: carbonic anhydrase [Coleofasciculaceae cyanobacterium]|jgi:carbonic anhydrase